MTNETAQMDHVGALPSPEVFLKRLRCRQTNHVSMGRGVITIIRTDYFQRNHYSKNRSQKQSDVLIKLKIYINSGCKSKLVVSFPATIFKLKFDFYCGESVELILFTFLYLQKAQSVSEKSNGCCRLHLCMVHEAFLASSARTVVMVWYLKSKAVLDRS